MIITFSINFTRFIVIAKDPITVPTDLASKIDYWIVHPEEKAEYSEKYLEYTQQFKQEHCMTEMEKMILETITTHKKLSR